nr:uncharacterized protein LOC107452262 [Parasteatoda tepidariorum]
MEMASLKEKIKYVFERSYILSFAEMAKTSSLKRIFFAFFIFTSSLVGFLYQMYEFSAIYLSYATEQTELSSNPNYVELPAISLCNVNSHRNSEVCKLNDSSSGYVKEANVGCKEYPKLCEESFKKYKVSCLSPEFEKMLETEEIWKAAETFAHTESMFYSCFEIIGNERKICDFFKPEKRPFGTFTHGITDRSPTSCYTFNSAVRNPNAPGKYLLKSSKIEMVLLTEAANYKNTLLKPGFFIAVHDRKTIVNPISSGDIVYGGNTYEYNIKKEIQTSLLPSPYDTNCTDYESLRMQKNGTGPSDFQDCLYKCLVEELIATNSCIPFHFPISHKGKICKKSMRRSEEYEEICKNSCGNKPCFEKTYEVEILKKGQITCDSSTIDLMTEDPEEVLCLVNNISLTITFNQFLLTKVTTVPRIQYLEIASRVGGYLGLWTGISILQLADIVVRINIALFYALTHLKKCCIIDIFLSYLQSISVTQLVKSSRNRKLVCEEQPHKCEFFKTEEELCDEYPNYCNLDDAYLGVFKDNPACGDDCYTWQRAVDEFKQFITFVDDNNFLHFYDRSLFNEVPFADSEGEPAVCMSYALKYGIKFWTNFNRTIINRNIIKTTMKNQTTVQTLKDIVFNLRSKWDEYLDPSVAPAFYLAIHDSRRLVNPFRHGIKLQVPGYHEIQVTDYVEQHLLPYPYDTNCTLFNPVESTDENLDLMVWLSCTTSVSEKGVNIFSPMKNYDIWKKTRKS